MHAVQAEYWNQIRSGILPEGSPVASWLLASCGLDRASTVAPSSRASTVETIETQDSTTEAH